MKRVLICLMLCLSFIMLPLAFSGCVEKPPQKGEIVLPDDDKNHTDQEDKDENPEEDELNDRVLKESCKEIINILIKSGYFDNEHDFLIKGIKNGARIICQTKTFSLEEFGILNAFLQSKLDKFEEYMVKPFIEDNKFIITLVYK